MQETNHFFHSPVLASITSRSSYFTPRYFPFSFFDHMESFHVLGLVAGKSYSRRAVIYDLPYDFTQEDSHRNLKRLLVSINSEFRDCVYIEIRNLGNLRSHDANILHDYYAWQDWLNIIVDTGNAEQSWQNVDENKRRQIRSSLEKGAEIFEAENEEQIHAFYDILKNRYKSKIRKPLPDRDFFTAFYNETKGTQWGSCLLVRHEGRVIGGMICAVSPGSCAYEWYIAGLDQEYRGTGIFPSVLSTWAGIEYAIRNNIPKFNFMGAGVPGKPYGVRDFKMQFGGELVNAGRYVKVNRPFWYWVGKRYVGFWGRREGGRVES